MQTKKVAVLGAGLMGYAAAYELTHFEPTYQVTICDQDEDALARAAMVSNAVRTLKVDLSEPGELLWKLRGHKALLSALPYFLNPGIAKVALELNAHYIDLGGNTDKSDEVFSLGERARLQSISFLPDAGLAPGLVNILTAELLQRLPSAHTVQLRVGGLPVHPEPPLDYIQVFSIDGLINEYRESCRTLQNGLITVVSPLTEIEHLGFKPDFPELEAFHTSGGSSTLPQTYAKKLRNLDYKTIRYRGHCARMRLLMDLGLFSQEKIAIDGQKVVPAQVLKHLLGEALPTNVPDVVLLRAMAYDDDQWMMFEMADYGDAIDNLSAMMRTTAYPATILLREQLAGNIQAGALRQEEVYSGERMIKQLELRGIYMKFSQGRLSL